jgi:hypothetical protein
MPEFLMLLADAVLAERPPASLAPRVPSFHAAMN